MADHEVRTDVRRDENGPTTLEERRWLAQLRWIRRARDYLRLAANKRAHAPPCFTP